jgi:hypothetical protein
MKLIGLIGAAVLSLTLGAVASVYAQEEHAQQDEHARQGDKKAQRDKPAQQEDKHAQTEEMKAQQEKPAQQEEKKAQQEEKKPQPEKPAAQHEQQAQHAGSNRGRIPEDRFRANFGREHTFRVSQGDYSNRRFQYGGYWFGFAGVWPSNWLYTQEVFVVEIDGVYYLCNPTYPGVNIALIVTL